MTHLQTNRNPMSSARRDQVHGPLVPMGEIVAHNLAGFGLVCLVVGLFFAVAVMA